jgi:trimeric autotransporter adhesin
MQTRKILLSTIYGLALFAIVMLPLASASNAPAYQGQNNKATGSNASASGGVNNTASGQSATIAGGSLNLASGNSTSIGGGHQNKASMNSATVAGGQGNQATGEMATISGGLQNVASKNYATVAGGYFNNAGGNVAAVGGGFHNEASGDSATVAGGRENVAAGDKSFAAGYRAKVAMDHKGTFLFADSSQADFPSAAANEFAVRATGGVRFITGPAGPRSPGGTGVQLPAGGGAWSTLSDRNTKINFATVNGSAILAQLANLSIQSWNYRAQGASIRHIGPTAQDFYAAFNVGEDDRHISTVDADGVALAAIQELYRINQSQNQQIEQLRRLLNEKAQDTEQLRARLGRLEQMLVKR